jgi:hypothetical protein
MLTSIVNGLFKDVLSSILAPRNVSESWIGKNVEGSGRSLI